MKITVHQRDAIVECNVKPDTMASLQAGRQQVQCCHQ